MVDTTAVYAIADSHFVLHLLAPDEPDVAQAEGQDAGLPDSDMLQDAPAARDESEAAGGPSPFLPENLLEDFLDEVADMIEEVHERYQAVPGWDKALVYGFVDGVLAVADGSWSSLEDSYYEDARNQRFEALDAEIECMAGEFDGSRPWDEAVKGYVRAAVVPKDGQDAPSPLSAAFAQGFFYGADAAYELEWKVVVTPARNVMLTDEESISEAALAQAQAESGVSSGSLIDRVFDMMGIDLDELAEAIGAEESGEDGEGGEAGNGGDETGGSASAQA